MLKTLDLLIGATTVVLIFALAVTVLTQALTSLLNRKAEHLKAGLASLLLQLGISEPALADNLAAAVLEHPLLSQGRTGLGGRIQMGTVIHREEFTKLLLDAASDEQQPSVTWPSLEAAAKASLIAMLKDNGIADPAATLKQVHQAAMDLELARPDLATDVRESMAILQKASSDYVARLNSWFDQTIDRVSQQFARHTRFVTVSMATLVVLSVQLDMIAVVNRLSVDDTLRAKVVQSAICDTERGKAAADPASRPCPALKPANTNTGAGQPDQVDFQTQDYYSALGEAGLITFPLGGHWAQQWSARKIPGILLAILLVSLGAPFWYNALKDLLGLRSNLAKQDDSQRMTRQTTQEAPPGPC